MDVSGLLFYREYSCNSTICRFVILFWGKRKEPQSLLIYIYIYVEGSVEVGEKSSFSNCNVRLQSSIGVYKMSATTVLVTGASGFIALHVLDTLLKKGFNVIGTVRSEDKGEKIFKQFKEEYPKLTKENLSFEIVKDISTPDAFDKVLEKHPEITEVLHTASPFSFGLNKDLKEAYLKPATEGTKNILTAVKKYAPQVKHVVVTSSFAAIVNRDKSGDPSFIHTEETWNPVKWEDVEEETKAYTASKKYAEVLARDFVKNEKPSFTLTTVNPPYVLGPQKFSSALVNPVLNTSAEIVNKLLSSDPKDTEFFAQPTGLSADVRDVALLHVLPLENSKLAGARLFPVNGSFNGQVLLNLINKDFPALHGKIAKGKPEGAEETAKRNGAHYDTSKTLAITGIKEWIPLEKTIKDSVSQILQYKSKN